MGSEEISRGRITDNAVALTTLANTRSIGPLVNPIKFAGPVDLRRSLGGIFSVLWG